MAQLIKSEGFKAIKTRRDDSANYLIEAMDYIRHSGKLTFSELRAIAKLKANKWQILRGDIYVRQWCENEDGNTYSFCTLPKILRICIKHNLYGE